MTSIAKNFFLFNRECYNSRKNQMIHKQKQINCLILPKQNINFLRFYQLFPETTCDSIVENTSRECLKRI